MQIVCIFVFPVQKCHAEKKKDILILRIQTTKEWRDIFMTTQKGYLIRFLQENIKVFEDDQERFSS